MERVLVLAARRYDFTGKDGNHVEGVQVSYVTDEQVQETDNRGCPLFQVTAPVSIWPDLPTMPAFYDVEFRQRPGLKGKPTLQITSASYVLPVRFNEADDSSV